MDRIFEALTIRRGIRFVIFFTFCIGYYVVALYSLIPLYDLAINKGDLVGGALFLSQSIFILQGQIMSRTPAVIPPDSFKWGYVPEYRRIHEELYGNDGEEDSPFVDYPYILDEIKEDLNKSLKEFQYQRKGEAFLMSGDYGEYETKSPETEVE